MREVAQKEIAQVRYSAPAATPYPGLARDMRGALVAPQRVGAAARAASVRSRAKRALDVCGAIFGLAVLSPLLAAVWVAVRLTSPGRAIFVQTRIGRDGRPLQMFKFRTMYQGNSSDAHRKYVTTLIAKGPAGLQGESGAYKIENDPRVTAVGRFMRRMSIDELPQLVNVLRGEMSLVGPRPPLGYEVELYTARHMRRLEVTPGMTGLWQVSGRTRLSFEQMIDLDLEYVDHWSLWLDLKILLRTVSVVLGREGAW